MADLSAKSGSGYDLLKNPSANFDLVLGSACEDCCDSPCVCYDSLGCPIYKPYLNANHPLGICLTHAELFDCKCLSADLAEIEDVPDATVTLTGSGTANPIIERGFTRCAAPTYGCDWSGAFVVPCGSPVCYTKGVYICTFYSFVLDRLVDAYYYMFARFAWATPNNGMPATFTVILASSTNYTNPGAFSSYGWTELGGDCGVPTGLVVRVERLYTSTPTFETYLWDETLCPPVECQPFTQYSDCDFDFTTPGPTVIGTTSTGCYPDPANVTVSISV